MGVLEQNKGAALSTVTRWQPCLCFWGQTCKSIVCAGATTGVPWSGSVSPAANAPREVLGRSAFGLTGAGEVRERSWRSPFPRLRWGNTARFAEDIRECEHVL
jgi:hypothetical protein